MNERVSLRSLPPKIGFRKGDVFVLFGELFDRGYASGLVAEARDAGMQIFGMTTGRRGENNVLRPLTEEELSAAEANLGGRIVNVPLMSGFELDGHGSRKSISRWIERAEVSSAAIGELKKRASIVLAR